MITLITNMRHRAIPAFVFVAILFMMLLLAGCSIGGSPAEDDPKSSTATVTPEPVETPTPLPASNMALSFGETMVWEDDVSMTVSAPEPYQPSAYAAGVIPGLPVVKFQVTLTNGNPIPLEPLAFSTAASGGQEASEIFDIGDAMGSSPTTSLLQGDTVSWWVAYSVADPESILFEISPGFSYKEALFTNRLP